ncbi:Hsp20/alpha crystallin family protein [bacterium]|nr:Hsp20/alpha crystallin family protein [bacterium]
MLIRWNPETPTSMMNRMWDDFFGRHWETEGKLAFSPSVDVKETKDALIVKAELPGLTKEDVHISIENGMLTISGDRKFEKVTEKDTYHLQELRYGSFLRRFTLGDEVDDSKIDAHMENGVLTVTLGKKESAKPRKIDVKVK